MKDANKVRKGLGSASGENSVRQGRAVVTRGQLLRAARAVFVRDGFQNARIEDIAAKAGKTRGAFYANFTDKEDVFLALFELDLTRDIAELRLVLKDVPSLEERIGLLTRYLVKLTKERERILLNLEFKMYAIRHPKKRKRLAELHNLMLMRSSLPEIDDLLPRQHLSKEDPRASMAVGAIVEGLAIGQLFDPGSLSDGELERYLGVCLQEKLRYGAVLRA